jgi:hypothetical protein
MGLMQKSNKLGQLLRIKKSFSMNSQNSWRYGKILIPARAGVLKLV